MSHDTQVKQEDDKEQIIGELLKGCSNWHDITHVIAPRIRKLLSEHGVALATVRREVWSAAIEIAKEELVPEPCSELDESFNAATRDVITKLEKASAGKKEGMNGRAN